MSFEKVRRERTSSIGWFPAGPLDCPRSLSVLTWQAAHWYWHCLCVPVPTQGAVSSLDVLCLKICKWLLLLLFLAIVQDSEFFKDRIIPHCQWDWHWQAGKLPTFPGNLAKPLVSVLPYAIHVLPGSQVLPHLPGKELPHHPPPRWHS